MAEQGGAGVGMTRQGGSGARESGPEVWAEGAGPEVWDAKYSRSEVGDGDGDEVVGARLAV